MVELQLALRRDGNPAGTEPFRPELFFCFANCSLKWQARGQGGGKVKSRKQAIAIGLREARKAGNKVPKRKTRKRKRKKKKS